MENRTAKQNLKGKSEEGLTGREADGAEFGVQRKPNRRKGRHRKASRGNPRRSTAK
jgi:hypothetical protein